MNLSEFINGISGGSFDGQFRMLYGSSDKAVLRARARYLSAAERFSGIYPENSDIRIFTAPAAMRTGGDTFGEHGCVLAAAVSLDIIAVAAFHKQGIIRVKPEGADAFEVKLDSLEPKKEEKGTPAALIRGIAAGFREKGVETEGFDAYILSDIRSGSGLSETAALEILIGTIICAGHGSGETADIAEIGRNAETGYYGRTCREEERLVSASGGFILLDTSCGEEAAKHFSFGLERSGYSVCITNTSGEDKTENISSENAAVSLLYENSEEEFYKKLPVLRKEYSDMELLRAAHFRSENERAVEEAEALSNGDTERFFELVDRSGASSAELLRDSCDDGLALGVMLSRRFLGGNGAVRIQSGMIQAFVPNYLAEEYAMEMERLFGFGNCYVLSLRNAGGYELEL